jgi:hypothetical protein
MGIWNRYYDKSNSNTKLSWPELPYVRRSFDHYLLHYKEFCHNSIDSSIHWRRSTLILAAQLAFLYGHQ